MYLIPFTNVAGATRCIGELTVAPFAGVLTHTDPAGPGPGLLGFDGAESGNGATPELGPFAITIGTAWQDCCGVAGVGEGAGAGAGAGVLGLGAGLAAAGG
jgi:hypothetical protein